MTNEKVTPEMIANWIGSDTTRDQILELFAAIANGEYTAEQFCDDVKDYNQN